MKLENIFAMTSSIFSSRPSLMHFISVNFPKKSSFFEALGTNLATFLLCILTICSKQALILHFLKSCILFKSQKLGVFFFFFGWVFPPFPKLHLLVGTLGTSSNVACNSASLYFFQDKEKVRLNLSKKLNFKS